MLVEYDAFRNLKRLEIPLVYERCDAFMVYKALVQLRKVFPFAYKGNTFFAELKKDADGSLKCVIEPEGSPDATDIKVTDDLLDDLSKKAQECIEQEVEFVLRVADAVGTIELMKGGQKE